MAFWKQLLRDRGRTRGVEGLKTRLSSFQDLVAKNNRVLELFADAGEKLGGEYVFDIQYLHGLARSLEEEVRGVVQDLEALTGRRNKDLRAAVERVSSEIGAVIDSRVVAPKADYVIDLDAVDADLAEVVGMKMARLGEIRNHLGLRVPDGFVVTTYACRQVLDHAGVTLEMEEAFGGDPSPDPDRLKAVAAALAGRLEDARIPAGVARAIRTGMSRLGRNTRCRKVAVRSSALGEDGDLSFAGKYRTVLGVTAAELTAAYRQVISSLYTHEVMRYRMDRGAHPGRGLMAVGCLCMVRAKAAGVLYTLDPSRVDEKVVVVSAVRGLGKAVVEGVSVADRFVVARDAPYDVLSRDTVVKDQMTVTAREGGLKRIPVPEAQRSEPALSEGELRELVSGAMRIERYMKCAQDIEWAVDTDGRLYFLQARPLRLSPTIEVRQPDLSGVVNRYKVLMRDRGEVACRGIASGRVHIVENDDALGDLPEDAVLVARTSSPRLASAMSRIQAVITDVGTATGHLAAIAREFRVPAIVDTRCATDLLAEGMEVTVDAEENRVYEGRVDELVHSQLLRRSAFEDAAEYRLLRGILGKAAPLNLKDPQSSSFTASNCATYHDIIRYAHEKAVEELSSGRRMNPSRNGRFVRRLELGIPLDLVMIDLGGGFRKRDKGRSVGPGDLTSKPLCALLDGLMTEGVWATGPADMDLDGFMSSATRAAPLSNPLAARVEHNLAIVSESYLNLSLHLGYHFNIVDAHLTDRRDENYIYFRFAGGVTEMARRARRATLLKRILVANDFVVEGRQDLVIGRIKKVPTDVMKNRLRIIGRLVGFTRQLDIHLRDDDALERCVNGFLEGRNSPLDCTGAS
ncbi:MAG: pyruvate, water dikinase [Deltaproteobacteria bacterium]|nr:pyruvate, water dikinase [Deltaproteobacteria bacterium]